jgi:hypothetical protein
LRERLSVIARISAVVIVGKAPDGVGAVNRNRNDLSRPRKVTRAIPGRQDWRIGITDGIEPRVVIGVTPIIRSARGLSDELILREVHQIVGIADHHPT